MECVVNEEYTKILCDEIFLKTITVRTSTPENNIDLLRAYNIPIPKSNIAGYYSPSEVLKIVDRLKNIAKDIDWNDAVFGNYTSEVISFMALLEVIAGKRNLNKLAYLVFHEMYI